MKRTQLDKQEVHYQERPHDGDRCATCTMFRNGANRCTLVRGYIYPNGWCDRYESRS